MCNRTIYKCPVHQELAELRLKWKIHRWSRVSRHAQVNSGNILSDPGSGIWLVDITFKTPLYNASIMAETMLIECLSVWHNLDFYYQRLPRVAGLFFCLSVTYIMSWHTGSLLSFSMLECKNSGRCVGTSPAAAGATRRAKNRQHITITQVSIFNSILQNCLTSVGTVAQTLAANMSSQHGCITHSYISLAAARNSGCVTVASEGATGSAFVSCHSEYLLKESMQAAVHSHARTFFSVKMFPCACKA